VHLFAPLVIRNADHTPVDGRRARVPHVLKSNLCVKRFTSYSTGSQVADVRCDLMSHPRPESQSDPSGLAVRRTQLDRRNTTEQALLASARQLVAVQGVDRTSVADVGESAGYSRGSVNHRFGSKQALLHRLAHQTQQSVEGEFLASGVLEYGAAVPAVESIVVLANVYFEWVETGDDDACAFFTMWGAAFPHESALREQFVEFDKHFRDRFTLLIHAGQANGSVRSTVDAAEVSVVLVGMIRGIAAQRVVAPHLVDLQAVRATVESFVRRTLAPA
jgi:AcrR family transcriptional regulator